MSCMGRNLPLRVMLKVAVLLIHSLKRTIGMNAEPFLDIAVLPTETYFEFV